MRGEVVRAQTLEDIEQAIGLLWRSNGSPPSICEVAARAGYSPSTVTLAVAELRHRGRLVKRNSANHRGLVRAVDAAAITEALAAVEL
jgi:hypothetical protein